MAKTRHRGTTWERLAVVSSKLPQHSGTSPHPSRESGCCLRVDKKTFHSAGWADAGRGVGGYQERVCVLLCVLPCFSGQEKVGPETRSGMRTRVELQGATRRRPWETGGGKPQPSSPSLLGSPQPRSGLCSLWGWALRLQGHSGQAAASDAGGEGCPGGPRAHNSRSPPAPSEAGAIFIAASGHRGWGSQQAP